MTQRTAMHVLHFPNDGPLADLRVWLEREGDAIRQESEVFEARRQRFRELRKLADRLVEQASGQGNGEAA